MTEYQINLIRDMAGSSGQRKMFFLGMVLYLMVCGIAIVGVVYYSMTRITRAQTQQREISHLEEQFRADHPDETDMQAFADRLKKQLENRSGELKSVEEILGQRMSFARILFSLALPLPKDVNIMNVELDREKNQLRFDIMVPLDEGGGQLTPGELIDLWNRDPALMAQVDNITSEISERQVIGDHTAFVFRFSCRLGRMDA